MECAKNRVKVILSTTADVYTSPDRGTSYHHIELFDCVGYIAYPRYIVLTAAIF
jgi:hypothetical protein